MSESERKPSSRLMLLSFMVSSFSTQPPGLITGLLLVDIGLTFGVQVGVSGQIRTLSSVVGFFTALLLGVVSVRVRSRTLLLAGLGLQVVSAVGCFAAWDFTSMLVLYSLNGIAVTMIMPMVNTLIGENFPQDRRSRILGWSAAGTSIAYLVCSPLVGLISGFAGWRMAFLALMLPMSLLGLAIGLIGVPGGGGGRIGGHSGAHGRLQLRTLEQVRGLLPPRQHADLGLVLGQPDIQHLLLQGGVPSLPRLGLAAAVRDGS